MHFPSAVDHVETRVVLVQFQMDEWVVGLSCRDAESPLLIELKVLPVQTAVVSQARSYLVGMEAQFHKLHVSDGAFEAERDALLVVHVRRVAARSSTVRASAIVSGLLHVEHVLVFRQRQLTSHLPEELADLDAIHALGVVAVLQVFVDIALFAVVAVLLSNCGREDPSAVAACFEPRPGLLENVHVSDNFFILVDIVLLVRACEVGHSIIAVMHVVFIADVILSVISIDDNQIVEALGGVVELVLAQRYADEVGVLLVPVRLHVVVQILLELQQI
mmetsp:Transcript_27440/g.41724  ORF Transcript_27440/g.41724 Transcript_27440/m.41724 type:complete len:276 (+) Transcript_27440:184-1011(+)